MQKDFSIFCVCLDGDLAIFFGLRDTVRSDALKVVRELQRRSIQISIVSGDNEGSVRALASVLDIPASYICSGCSPADKASYVESLADSVVIFCGDGTNDAPALARASIGIHISGGTDVAEGAADVFLLRPALVGIIILLDLSRAFCLRVRFNFIWSLVYNSLAILLTACAVPHARIPPAPAGLGEIVSVLPVIAIALQLRWWTFPGLKST
jgi:P-type E1-E2 ATPase